MLGAIVAAVVGLVLRHRCGARRTPLVSQTVGFFVEFIRGTPLLVQLYFIFYVLPDIGIRLPPLVAGVIGLGLHYGTYAAEVYRAGIENVPRGQWEAAKAANLTAAPDLDPCDPAAGDPADDPGAGQLSDRHVQGDAAAVGHHRAGTDEPGEERRQFSSYRYTEPMTLVGVFFLVISLISVVCLRWLEERCARSGRRDDPTTSRIGIALAPPRARRPPARKADRPDHPGDRPHDRGRFPRMVASERDRHLCHAASTTPIRRRRRT